MAESKNKQIVRQFMESLQNDRIEVTREIMTDDFVWHLAPSLKKALGFPDAIRGADAVIKWLNGLNTSVYKRDENKRFIIHELVEEGNTIAVVWKLMTETPAGKPYTNDYIYLCRLSNGKVSEVTTYNDTAHAYDELLPKT